jgi:hypothetical protein
MHGGHRGKRARLAGQRLAAVAVLAVTGLGAYLVWPSQPLNSKTTCVYAGDTTRSLAGFSKLAGQQVNCAVLFSYSNTGWDQWADPWFTRASRDGTDWAPWIKADPGQRRIVITQEMVPADVPADWRVLGADGAYDGYARRFAANLVAAGMGNAVLRLGHEMNTGENHDSLGPNPAQYRDWADYWARIVRAMRSVPGAHFLFDWNVNAGYRDIPLASYYPGNDVVDMIGIDIYDSGMPGNPKNSAARWASLDSEPGGLADIVAFARAHDKPLSFPEWGVVDAASGGIGDDPGYVRAIANQVKDNPVVYQAYFDRPTGGVLPLQDAPMSLRVWREYFGPAGTAPGHSW